jgi:hypothetical protein
MQISMCLHIFAYLVFMNLDTVLVLTKGNKKDHSSSCWPAGQKMIHQQDLDDPQSVSPKPQ